MSYTPVAIMCVGPTASMPPKPAYAPQSPITRQRSPVILPSSASPSSTYCTWPRPCIESIASRPGLRPGHRPAQAAGRRDQHDVLGRHTGLAAERAADVRGDDADPLLVEAEGARERRPCDVRHLGGHVHGEVVVVRRARRA